MGWYQHTWVWLVVALVLVGVVLAGPTRLESVLPTPTAAVLPVLAMTGLPACVWMAALVARHGWGRFALTLLTAVVMLLHVWVVFHYNQQLESNAYKGCEVVETADGETTVRDPSACATLENGTLESRQRNVWIISGAVMLGPLAVLYIFRERLRTSASAALEETLG